MGGRGAEQLAKQLPAIRVLAGNAKAVNHEIS